MELSYFTQLEKQYKNYLKNLVSGKDFEPIVLRGGKTKPSTTAELYAQIALFQKNEKTDVKPGWTITWQDWFSKKLGNQKWPSQILVSTEEDLLYLIVKKEHSNNFKELLLTLLEWRPTMREMLLQRPELVHDHKDDWKALKAVTDYLLNNDTTGLYIRSIPVPAHTKFIQQKKGILLSLLKHLKPEQYSSMHSDLEQALGVSKKPFLFTMRFLDRELAKKYLSGIGYFALPVEEIRNQNWEIKKVILVENETNLYLLPEMNNTLAIFSSGKALHLLTDIELLTKADCYYWGDLDEEGFAMLNKVRDMYPAVKSICMDIMTVEMHIEEMHTQPQPYKFLSLDTLSTEERKAYNTLSSHNGRIEQERLYQDYVMTRLREL